MDKKSGAGKPAKPTLWSEMTKSWFHVLFCFLNMSALLAIVPMYQKGKEYIEYSKAHMPEGYEWPSNDCYWIAAKVAPMFAGTQFVSVKIMKPLIAPFCKIQNDLKQRETRSQKMSTCFFNMLFYTGITIAGYVIQKDTYYLPPMLGGKGDLTQSLSRLPYPPKIPGLETYYMVQLGWHISSIARMLFLEGLRPDTVEMSLHHGVTIALVVGSAMFNGHEIGGLILLLHDTNNILVCMWRFSNELPYKKLVNLITFSLIVAWIYFRIFCLYRVTYFLWTVKPYHLHNWQWLQPLLSGLVTFLLVIHAYWLKLIVTIFISGIMKGEQEDTTTNFQKPNAENGNKVESKKM